MGLDMYAYKVDRKCNTPVIAKRLDKIDYEKIFYWRKNRFMHNLIEGIFVKKGGTGEFNCVFVELDDKDINYIEKAVLDGTIDGMDAPGYYFGNLEYTDDSRAYDMEFVLKARQTIKDGYKVYYYSWW